MRNSLIGYFLLLVALLAGSLGSSARCDDDLAKRISASKADTKMAWCRPENSPFAHERGKSILAELGKANRSTLSSPVLCDARFWYHTQGKAVEMVVYWVEDRPSPNGLRLTWKGQSKTKDYSIDDAIMGNNKSASKLGVVYWAAVNFEVGDPEERELAA